MPVAFCRSCHVALQMLELQRERKFVVVRHGGKREEIQVSRVHKRTTGTTGHRKKAGKQKGRLLHFTYMNYQIKSVTSEIRSVNIHPQRGCLQWPYGTVLEPP